MRESTEFINQRIVVDCSVLLKLFLDEGNRALIRELVALHKKQQLALMASHLIIFELLNALSKKTKNPELVSRAFEDFKNIKLVMLEPRDDYIKEAYIKSCMEKEISFYDSSYHALAKDFDGIFLTADKKYYEATKKEGNVMLYESA